MKQFLFRAFLAFTLFISTKTIYAQCSQDQIGAPNYSVTSQMSAAAVGANGTNYVVSYNSGLNKLFLHSCVLTGSWTPLASLSTSLTVKPAISISKTGKVYIAIRDEPNGKVGKLYYLSGGTLIQVGTAFSGLNNVSDLSIAFNSIGEEYVAYTDASNLNKSTVKKYSAGSWISVGTGTVSTGAGYYNSLIIDKTDSPVLAFQDGVASNKITVMKFTTGSWAFLTNLGTSTSNSKIKLGQNGDYYVGYTETGASTAVVQKYNGSVWGALGSPVTNLKATPNTFDLDLDPNDVPYFIATNNTSNYAVSFKYTGVPTWSNTAGNLSAVTSTNVNISIDQTGSPFFFFVDQTNNNGLNVKTLTSPISISSQPLSVTRCNGQSGSFSVGTVGGAPTSYQWQTLGAGTYSNSSAPYTNVTTSNLAFTANTSMNQNEVRCVVNVGCKNIISNTSTLTVTTLSATTTSTNPTCFNTGDGAINVIVSGGISPYTFTWSPVGGNTSNPTGLYWNTYTLTSTDINGCAITETVALTSPPSLNTSFSGNMNICSGSNTTLTITASGGTPGYTYSWTPGGSLSTTTGSVVIANPGTTQTYNVSVTDALGCVATDTVMVNVTASPTVTSGANSAICNGSSATLNGGGANTYTWNPGNLVGGTQIVNPTSTTIYTVVGTNTLSGCTNTAITTVTVNALPTVNAGPTRTLTCANTSTTLAGSTTGGVSYSWTGPGIVSGATTLNPTINAAGNYDLTVTSAQGCSAGPSPVTVFQNITPPSPTAANSTTLTCLTTTGTVIGTGGGTYNWAGPGIISGAATSTPTINLPGTYNLTVTAANGCTATANTAVTQNTVIPTTTASNSSTLTCVTTTVSLIGGPAAGVSYQWSGAGFSGGTTSQNAIANAAGVYTLLATSLTNGCSKTATTSLTQNVTPPTASASNSSTLTCSTTTAMLTGTGGGTYNWSGSSIASGATSSSPIITGPGCYTLVVTSAVNGCTATAITCVTQNTVAPSVSGSASNTITCLTSTANAIASTTTTPVTYTWSGTGILSGAATSVLNVNTAGIKNYTVTNTSNGCFSSGSVNIIQNISIPSATLSPTSPLCNGACNGSITTNVSGGLAPYSYVWTPGGATTSNLTALCAGNYSVLISGANGCSVTKTVSLTQPTAITSNITSSTINCFGLCNGAISASPIGGTGAYSYTLNSSGAPLTSNPPYSALCSGNYTVIIKDVNGCTITNSLTLNQPSPLSAPISGNQIICSGGNTTLSVSPIGGTPGYTINWSPGATLSSTIAPTVTATPISNQTYTATINDANGCNVLSSITITVNATPTLAITGNTNMCKGSTTNLTASGATSYTWDSGANTTTISVTPTITTTYTLNGDNGNGCFSSMPITVSIIPNKAITGIVTSTAGATGGDIIIYKYTAALSQWDSLTITPIGGTYTFNNIDSGLYVLRALPTATNIQVSYAPSSISWQSAGVINHGCTINTSQNIDLIGLSPITLGTGIITGTIIEASGFGSRMTNEFKPLAPGNPIGGIIVKGGKNPGGQMFVQTTTDAAGAYTLQTLPLTGTDDYFVFVDIPGLDTNLTYHYVLTSGANQLNGLNFTVDSIYINPIANFATGISNDQSVLESKITLFPNPANQIFTLQYELTKSAIVQIELYSMIGHKVKVITPSSFEEKNNYSHSVNLEDLSNGVYFVKVKINNSETTIKLIVAN